MSRKIIPVSINDEKMLEYLESKENVSHYIRKLIKDDMENKKELPQELKILIDEYIQKTLKKQ